MIFETITFFSLLSPISSISHGTGELLPLASKIPSGIYEHYKGGYYLVFFVALHSETEQEMVIYQPLSGDFRIWSRPLTMFLENVEYNGVQQPRFKWVADSAEAQKFLTDQSR